MTNTLKMKKRVRKELLASGVTPYGIRKSESLALYEHIAKDEHILAAIYGQFESSSAMLVATDKRILFIDIRALHNIVEDTTYDSFGDIQVDEGIVFSRVTLRTKPREYIFHMVNRRCARRFLNVLESKTLAQGGFKSPPIPVDKEDDDFGAVEPEHISFLTRHHVATLSTRGEDGYPYGVTLFYFYDRSHPDDIFIITKSTTRSAQNLRKHDKVAFTITDEKTMATMHVLGRASLERDAKRKNKLIGMLFEYGQQLSNAKMPPVTQIKEGGFVIYATRIKQVSLKSYR